MKTKEYCLLKNNNDFNFDGCLNVTVAVENNQYKNINLNQNYKCSDFPVSIQSSNILFSKEKKFGDSLNQERCHKSSKKFSDKRLSSNQLGFLNNEFIPTKEEKDKKKYDLSSTKNNNSSTLSLHISAYKNGNEAQNQIEKDFSNAKDGIQKSKNCMQKSFNKIFPSPKFQNYFEFPRQQQENNSENDNEPEIIHFKASQKLLNPNSPSTSNSYDKAVAENRMNKVEDYKNLEESTSSVEVLSNSKAPSPPPSKKSINEEIVEIENDKVEEKEETSLIEILSQKSSSKKSINEEIIEIVNLDDENEEELSSIEVLSQPQESPQFSPPTKKSTDAEIIEIDDDEVEIEVEEGLKSLTEKEFKELKDLPYPSVNMEQYFYETSLMPFKIVPPANNRDEFIAAILNGDSKTIYSTISIFPQRFDFELDKLDSNGKSLLHLIAESKCSERHEYDAVLEILVQLEASLSILDGKHFRTPLHTAIVFRNVCLAKMFVKLGSPLNTLDSKRFSPLISAINTKNVELVKLLLNSGANVEKGIEYAKISGMITNEITNILIAHQTKINICMNQARETIFPQAISAHYGTLPNSLHIIPMAETDTIKFPFTLAKGITLSQNHYLLFECAVIIIDPFNETISARMWHQSPIKSILINGTEPTYLQKTMNFLSLPILMEGKNSIKIELLNRIYKGTKYCFAARITHVFMPGFATKADLSVQQQQGYVNPKIRKQQQKYLQSLPSSSTSTSSSYRQKQQQQLTSKRMRPNGPYHLPTHNIHSEPPLLPSFSDYLQRPSSSSRNSAEQQQQQQDRYYPSPSFSASTIPRGFMKLRALAPANPSSTTTTAPPPPSMQRGTNRPLFLPLSAASNRNGSISSSLTSIPTTKRKTTQSQTHSTTSSQSISESSTTPRLQKQ